MQNSNQHSMFNPYPNNTNPYTPDVKPDTSLRTDIARIQAEIARDLAMIRSDSSLLKKEIEIEAGSDVTKIDITKIDIPNELDTTRETWFPATAKPYYPTAITSPESSGFYTETIKDTKKGARNRSWTKIIILVLVICIFGMGSLGFGIGAAYTWFTGQGNGLAPAEVNETGYAPTITSNRYIFEPGEIQTGTVADMVELLEPAVVSITTRFEGGARSPIAGSGTIFEENETRIFIATGYYIVPDNGIIHVRIADSRPLQARMVNRNRSTGLAVISVDKSQLVEAGVESYTIATFGDSSLMQVGDVVFAIGNARNEGISVTRGIISAGKQDLQFPDYTLTVLQTDAAINYGSSGGPLINLRGEVIGINIDRATVIFGTAAVEGIGYSIASNVVLPILQDIINPTTPGLGIMGLTVDEAIAEIFGIPPMGVLIRDVFSGGSADAANMLPGDIVTAFDGEPIFIMDELQAAIRSRQIGDVVEIRILRDGEILTLVVELKAFIR